MMDACDWFAAPYEPHGGTSGEGARRLLGQPSLDPLTVLVRETLQNAWDARVDARGHGIEYGIQLRTLDPSERAILANVIFAKSPGSPTSA
jgi:uncharacterized membrane protein